VPRIRKLARRVWESVIQNVWSAIIGFIVFAALTLSFGFLGGLHKLIQVSFDVAWFALVILFILTVIASVFLALVLWGFWLARRDSPFLLSETLDGEGDMTLLQMAKDIHVEAGAMHYQTEHEYPWPSFTIKIDSKYPVEIRLLAIGLQLIVGGHYVGKYSWNRSENYPQVQERNTPASRTNPNEVPKVDSLVSHTPFETYQDIGPKGSTIFTFHFPVGIELYRYLREAWDISGYVKLECEIGTFDKRIQLRYPPDPEEVERAYKRFQDFFGRDFSFKISRFEYRERKNMPQKDSPSTGGASKTETQSVHDQE